jgi:hypothetical protein
VWEVRVVVGFDPVLARSVQRSRSNALRLPRKVAVTLADTEEDLDLQARMVTSW